jgi:hypothetical protein
VSEPAVATCARCGATSPLRELYRKVGLGIEHHGPLCPYCWLQRPPHSALKVLVVAALAIAWVAAFGRARSSAAGNYPAALLVALLVTPLPTVVLHELAHLVGAWLVGFRPRGVRIGAGEVGASFAIGGFHVEIGRRWWRAGGFARFDPPAGTAPRGRLAFVVAAPYALHVALFLAAWTRGSSPEAFARWWFAGYQLLMIVDGLWPGTSAMTRGPNDGGLLVRLLAGDPELLARYRAAAYFSAMSERLRAGDGPGALIALERAPESARRDCASLRGLLQMLRKVHAPERADPALDADLALVRSDHASQPDDVRFAMGEPPGDDGVEFVRCLDLLLEDRLDELIERADAARARAPEGAGKSFWDVIRIATRHFRGDPDPPPARVSERLPWFDSALLTDAYALLERGEESEALALIERAGRYPRRTSPTPMREGYRAIAMARLGRADEARAAWEPVRSDAFPALTRMVERALP